MNSERPEQPDPGSRVRGRRGKELDDGGFRLWDVMTDPPEFPTSGSCSRGRTGPWLSGSSGTRPAYEFRSDSRTHRSLCSWSTVHTPKSGREGPHDTLGSSSTDKTSTSRGTHRPDLNLWSLLGVRNTGPSVLRPDRGTLNPPTRLHEPWDRARTTQSPSPLGPRSPTPKPLARRSNSGSRHYSRLSGRGETDGH